MKKISILLPFAITITYEEILFPFLIFNNVTNIFYKTIFSMIFSIFLYLIVSNISNKFSRAVRNTIITIICSVFVAQFVYYQIYKSIISFYSFSNGGQVFQFWQTILNVVKLNWNKIILILYPIIVTIGEFITRKINKDFKLVVVITSSKINKNIDSTTRKYRKTNRIKSILKGLIYIIILQIIALSAINLEHSNDIYSVSNLYNKSHVPTFMADKFGVLTTMRLDLQRLITNFSDNTLLATSDNFEIVEDEIPEYNMIDIDWDNIIENESDDNIKAMHQYFSIQEPTKKNKYTGMFEGKNVVVFVAEAFNEVAIDENITPTLYKLYNQGFQFENFYTPLFPVSTADGEYISDTSLIPKENVWSLSKISTNYMPYSYANAFERLGYTSHAYHNHSATYYDRDKYITRYGV